MRMLRRGGYAARMGDRFALYPAGLFGKDRPLYDSHKDFRRETGDFIWIHAVSVGEVQVAAQLMREWRKVEPNVRFCFSTTSSTGWKIAEKELASINSSTAQSLNRLTASDVLIYNPLDFPNFVKSALRTVRPRAIVLTESEIWPNFILQAKKMGIPLFLINARVSDRSAPRYKAAKWFFGDVLSAFTRIFAQSDLDKARLVAALPKFDLEKPVATRAACGTVMNALAPQVPGLVGGSADLGPSNKTILKGLGDVKPGELEGRNIHFGIRELGMSAIVNGITAFDERFRAYGATFFVFSDYCRPAIRLAALMQVPSIYVFSHDSYCVGEDGPTHEPIEHLAALRAMPNVMTWRPADANETAAAWVEILCHKTGPSCLLTSRQDLPVLEDVKPEGVAKGAYVIYQAGRQDKNTILFLATGSEVAPTIEAAKRLWLQDNQSVRVVSVPCVERFHRETTPAYRCFVLPQEMNKRVIVEAGTRFGLDRFRIDFRSTGYVTIDHYGASAPYKVLTEKFGFTVDNIYATAKALV